MTSFTSPEISTLLNQLFTEADAIEAAYEQQNPALAPEARPIDRSDYKKFYGLLKEQPLAVSRETGKLLYMLARAIGARSIVEFGTSFGISIIHLACALRDNGGGKLIGSEFEPSKTKRARQTLDAAGLLDLVEIREGDALETFAHDLPDQIDLVLLEGRLRAGALIIADNGAASWINLPACAPGSTAIFQCLL